MHPILTIVVLPIALGLLLYTYGKNSSFMCEDGLESEYQEGRRMTCNRIRAYNSGMGERLRKRRNLSVKVPLQIKQRHGAGQCLNLGAPAGTVFASSELSSQVALSRRIIEELRAGE
jgi:hypothetical protein